MIGAMGEKGVRERGRGDQFGLLGVAVQLLEEEENESGHRSLYVAHELMPLKSWLSLQQPKPLNATSNHFSFLLQQPKATPKQLAKLFISG